MKDVGASKSESKKARNSEKSEFLAFLYKNDLFSDLEGRF